MSTTLDTEAIKALIDEAKLAQALATLPEMPSHWGGTEFMNAARAVIAHLTEGSAT